MDYLASYRIYDFQRLYCHWRPSDDASTYKSQHFNSSLGICHLPSNCLHDLFWLSKACKCKHMKNLTLFVTSKFKFSNEHFFIKTNSQVSPRTPVACEQINALIIQKSFKVLIKQIVGARAATTAIIPFQYC